MDFSKNISLLIYIYLFQSIVESYDHRGREKRFIVYPKGGSFKLVIGIGTPVKIGSKQSMAIGWNLQMQYAEPQNATQLLTYPPIYTGKRSIDGVLQPHQISDRVIFYEAFEDIFSNEGLNGRECLLRSICENAMESFAHEANGLYGQIFHIILTPNYGDGEIDSDLNPIYLDAQRAGEYGVECQTLYSGCGLRNGLLDIFSVLDSQLG